MTKKRKKKILFVLVVVGAIIAIFSIMLVYKYIKPNTTSQDECRIDGCSQEICLGKDDQPIVSECLWKEEYGCYKTAKCEVQGGGKCGWSQTDELKSCLSKYR